MNEDSLDQNKSPLTLRVTAGVETFLKERGFKPIETEVPVGKEWVADVASVVAPTLTEMQKLKIIPPKPKYVYCDTSAMRQKFGNEWFSSKECQQSQEYQDYETKRDKRHAEIKEWEAKAKVLPCPITALVEVKTTRADFQRDDKWTRLAPTNMRFIAIPAGMLKRPEFPQGWGVLEFGSEGKLYRVAQQSDVVDVTVEQRMWTIHEIALKRHHRTEHVWLRDLRKKMGARERERRQSSRFLDIINAVLDIISAGGHYHLGSVDECLSFHGVQMGMLPEHVQERLRNIWGITVVKINPNKLS